MGDVFSAQGAGREKSPLAPFVVGDSRSLTSYAADQPQLADLFASGFCLSTLTSLISSRRLATEAAAVRTHSTFELFSSLSRDKCNLLWSLGGSRR